MIRYLRPPLLRQFLAVRRDAGLRAALSRAGRHVAARLGGRAPGVVPRSGSEPSLRYLGGTWRTLAQSGAFHISTPPAHVARRRSIALIGDLNLPQCRKYRVEQLREFWQLRDVDLRYAHYQDVPRAVHILQDATHLICYRLPACPDVSMYLYEARRLRLPVLYDIDDPLFSVSACEGYGNMSALPAGMRAHHVAQAPRYLDVMNACDAVSVSTPGLAAHARLYTSRPVLLRRNFADRRTLRTGRQAMQQRPARQPGLRVAFASGSRGHEADFAEIAGPLERFVTADPRRRLMILGHFDRARLPRPLARQAEWQAFSDYAGYLGALAQADCAVVPLADDAFNRCKSAVRVIDAAAVGVPALCSAVGDLSAMVRPGRTGFVLQAATEWDAALEALAADGAAAQERGRRARADLEARWCAQTAPHIADAALLDWVLA